MMINQPHPVLVFNDSDNLADRKFFLFVCTNFDSIHITKKEEPELIWSADRKHLTVKLTYKKESGFSDQVKKMACLNPITELIDLGNSFETSIVGDELDGIIEINGLINVEVCLEGEEDPQAAGLPPVRILGMGSVKTVSAGGHTQPATLKQRMLEKVTTLGSRIHKPNIIYPSKNNSKGLENDSKEQNIKRIPSSLSNEFSSKKEDKNLISPIHETLIKLVLNEEIEGFNESRSNELIQKIKILLDTKNNIEIINIEKGSVIVTMRLDEKNAKKLLHLLATGTLEGFDIEKAKLLNYNQESNNGKGISKLKNNNYQPSLVWTKQMKKSIANDDLHNVFEKIKDRLSPEEAIYDEAINLEARYNRNLRNKRSGIDSNNNIEAEFNVIRNNILNIINNISQIDTKK